MATSQTLGLLICDLMVFFSCLVVALYYSYKLTLVMASTGVPSAIILYLVNRYLHPAIVDQRIQLAQATKQATAAITAIDLVKVYNGADYEVWQYLQVIKKASKYYFRQALCSCIQMGYIKMWMIMLFVVGFYFSVVLFDRGELSPGNGLTTFYAAMIAFRSMEAIGPQWLAVVKGMVAGQTLTSLASNSTDENMLPERRPHRPIGCIGHLELRNVSLSNSSFILLLYDTDS
jgi:ATP-binding cassette subfamily B (MDR/TAP) protein 1